LTAEERIQAIARFGFTERQARFLVTVMLHEGVVAPPVRTLRRHGVRAKGERVLRQARQAQIRDLL
jgi:hypothetical protein